MAADGAAAALLDLPATLTLPFCTQLAAALDAATRRAPASSQPLTAAACVALLRRAEKLLKAEPTLVHVSKRPSHASWQALQCVLHRRRRASFVSAPACAAKRLLAGPLDGRHPAAQSTLLPCHTSCAPPGPCVNRATHTPALPAFFWRPPNQAPVPRCMAASPAAACLSSCRTCVLRCMAAWPAGASATWIQVGNSGRSAWAVPRPAHHL